MFKNSITVLTVEVYQYEGCTLQYHFYVFTLIPHAQPKRRITLYRLSLHINLPSCLGRQPFQSCDSSKFSPTNLQANLAATQPPILLKSMQLDLQSTGSVLPSTGPLKMSHYSTEYSTFVTYKIIPQQFVIPTEWIWLHNRDSSQGNLSVNDDGQYLVLNHRVCTYEANSVFNHAGKCLSTHYSYTLTLSHTQNYPLPCQ